MFLIEQLGTIYKNIISSIESEAKLVLPFKIFFVLFFKHFLTLLILCVIKHGFPVWFVQYLEVVSFSSLFLWIF